MSTPIDIDIDIERERLETAVMVDTVRITRPTRHAVLDEDTGMMGPIPTETVYEGAGAVLSGNGQVIAQHVLGREWLDDTVSWYRLLTPVSAPVLHDAPPRERPRTGPSLQNLSQNPSSDGARRCRPVPSAVGIKRSRDKGAGYGGGWHGGPAP
ncbi:DUF6093 family protein [Streptomyces sp. NPDC058240]|uniref:DUF6093 family protein n=1 Tax=Streptomyces sp. NPDC058240 TaxID=3346396 RepID=UPI0036E2030B